MELDSEERIDILNADGSFTGKSCSKFEIHTKGYYHNTSHVWLYNDNGNILLSQRAASKSISPLLWNVSAAGHVDTGESIIQAAVRETHEELGIKLSENDLEKIGVNKSFRSYPNGIQDNEFHNTFIAKISVLATTFDIDTDEVAAVKFVSIAEFRELLKNSANNGHFIAYNADYYSEVLEAIEQRL